MKHIDVRTHNILAPDTATLKPVCSFPVPFDVPLMLELNFLRISKLRQELKEGFYSIHNRVCCFLSDHLCHLVVLMCITEAVCDVLANVVTVSRDASPPMLNRKEKRKHGVKRSRCSLCGWCCVRSPPRHSSPLRPQLQQVLGSGTEAGLRLGKAAFTAASFTASFAFTILTSSSLS